MYDHTAVIVAEDITSRFLNVISLFNGTIPIIAIQNAGSFRLVILLAWFLPPFSIRFSLGLAMKMKT